MVKNPPVNAGDIRDVGSSLGQEDPLEEGMATHSSILACRAQRVSHDRSDLACTHSQNFAVQQKLIQHCKATMLLFSH